MNLNLIMLFNPYIPNHIVNFIIITELLKWIYEIVYENFGRYTLRQNPRFAAEKKFNQTYQHKKYYIMDFGNYCICFRK